MYDLFIMKLYHASTTYSYTQIFKNLII